MSDEIILYDLPSRQGKAWSLNTWKTRLALNFKGLPYKTEFVEYPDLGPLLEKAGVPPNATGIKYTLPTIRLPDGRYVMESRKIADVLDAEYPEPSLRLDSPYQARIEALITALQPKIRPIFAPLIPKSYLNPVSQKYFVATREADIGMPLDKFHEGADNAFNDTKPLIKQFGDLLDEHPGGPFFLGSEVSYADFVVVGLVRMLEGIGWAEKFFALDGGQQIKRQYHAAAKWLERDSY
ncbi:hypothetical protein A1O3_03543 [Capronia epimyces CBS 606.96]|uniref:GST N-terminal domain-containing protein n=1 Tax=Capronia epimyces CBS 606.96 TaxID=1182542 RepID=W9YAB4_9EURO|nr:uncharacterized protein A1O3_03543 [Capronia epimyces CBS 606.96]EXJ86590.1 hypothetical protein A1O3_03543 [Capronia epimyces CBS 606.96]